MADHDQFQKELTEAFGGGEPNPHKRVRIKYTFDHGLTVEGVTEVQHIESMFRDAADISKVVSEVAAGEPVVCVLPPGRVTKWEVFGA